MTVTGTGFGDLNNGIQVLIGAVPCSSIQYNSLTSLICVTPQAPNLAAANTNLVIKTAPDELGVSFTSKNATGDAYAYTLPSAITVTGISPNTGTMDTSTPVTITGAGFAKGAVVTIGGQTCTQAAAVSSSTQLNCNIVLAAPVQVTGASDVVVTNGTVHGTLTGGFTFQYPADITVASISPSSVDLSVPTTVTVTGTGFSPDSIISIVSGCALSGPISSFTKFTCVLTGGVYPSTSAAFEVSSKSTGTHAFLSGGVTFTLPAAITVTSVSTNNAPSATPTAVTVNGTGFAVGAVVTIGGVPCYQGGPVTMQNEITCTTAAGAPTGPAVVQVTNGGVTGSLSGAFTFF